MASYKQETVSVESHSQNIWETLVFIWNSALEESSIPAFQEIFASTDKTFISERGLSTNQ